jgi:hypothetical protein
MATKPWWSLIGVLSVACLLGPGVAGAEERPSSYLRASVGAPTGIGVAFGHVFADRIPVEVGVAAFIYSTSEQARIGLRFISSDVPVGSTGFRYALLAHAGALHLRSEGPGYDRAATHDTIALLGSIDVEATWIGESRRGFSMALGVGAAVPLRQVLVDSPSSPIEHEYGVLPTVSLSLGYAF